MPAPKRSGGGSRSIRSRRRSELELDWIDRMQRAVNPLPERLAFFWHRHWAISRADGSVSDKWAFAYRNHLLEYSDFAATRRSRSVSSPIEMTTKNAAMSAYLNLNANTKTKPNENYAREFMELFCLGPTRGRQPELHAGRHRGADAGVHRLAAERHRVLPDGTTPNPDYGKITFAPNQFTMTAKTILGGPSRRSPARRARRTPTNTPWGPSAVNQAIDIVLERAVQPQFLIRKLWAEFIAGPIPQATLDSLISTYLGSNPKYQVRPVIRGDPDAPADLRVAGRAEPRQAADRLHGRRPAPARRAAAPWRLVEPAAAMNDMQQRIYRRRTSPAGRAACPG